MYYTAMCNAMSMVPAAGHEKSDIAVAFGVLIFVSVDDFVLHGMRVICYNKRG